MKLSALTPFVFAASIYVFGCGTDSPVDTNNGEGCEDACTLGERLCLDDSTLESCQRNADGCLQLMSNACLSNELCQDGDCIDAPRECEDSCIPPASRCNQDGEAETCADHNNDTCSEFGSATACGVTEYCDASVGLCRDSACSDECTVSETSCQEGLLSTCTQTPEGCKAWGNGKECPMGQMCQNGACETSTACEDECAAGTSICTAEGGIRECTVGTNGCSSLQGAMSCPAEQTCRSGACTNTSACQDRCLAAEKSCIGNDLAECVIQSDGCLAFTNPSPCPSTQTCTNNAGVIGCTSPPTTGPVVINEVFYNPTGNDVRGGVTPVFVELLGPPGRDISDWTLELVNGSNGLPYTSVVLPANSLLDGNGFAVIASTIPDNFLSLAASGNKFFLLPPYATGQDALQNGPDNIVLKDQAGQVEDALGYGNFSANDPNFKGEGSAAKGTTPGRSIGRRAGVDTQDNQADFESFYPTPGLGNSDLVINEIYFDQPGTDTGSETFVELVAPIAGWEDLPLDGYVLRAINGFNGSDYIFTESANGIDMTGYSLNDGPSSGYVALCNIDQADNALLSACAVPFESVGDFQNGPDSFVLEYEGRVVDAIGYGNFTSAQTFLGEGSPATWIGSIAGQSLGRWPMSDPSVERDTGDNSVDFHVMPPSPGTSNPLPTP